MSEASEASASSPLLRTDMSDDAPTDLPSLEDVSSLRLGGWRSDVEEKVVRGARGRLSVIS